MLCMILAKTVKKSFRFALAGWSCFVSPALASPRFRLAGQGLAFSLGRWLSEVHVVFVRVGRPNGMVQLLFVAVSLFAAREWVRARGLGGSPRNVLILSDGLALGMEAEMDGGL